jgi:hypothetical protein
MSLALSLRRTAGFALTLGWTFALGNGCATSEDVVPPIGDPVPQGGNQTGLGGASDGLGGVTASSGSGGASPSLGGAKSSAGGRIFGDASGGKSGTGGKGSVGAGGKASVGAGGKASVGAGGKASVGAGGKSSVGTGGKASGTGGASGCDWTACTAKQCSTACPTTQGTYCATACTAYITCFQDNPSCSKAGDPLCVVRTGGAANVCTMEWESAGGPQTGIGTTGSPSAIAANYVACACELSIPGVMSSGSGGKAGF